MPLAPGKTLSHYRLDRKIGQGGMGVVWKAEDTVLGRTVALKVLPADVALDEARRKMFVDEARLASSLSHAHIAQVYELGRDEAVEFIVMEYVDGEPLSTTLHGRGLAPEQVVTLGEQVARALSRAHKKGLVHRDLKPGNILVTREGEAKVVDFGLATLLTAPDRAAFTLRPVPVSPDEAPTEVGPEPKLAGTPPYMSPEQSRLEQLDGRSDIFALGVVLYEMATGQRPFGGATQRELLEEIGRAHPRPVRECAPQAPAELERIIQKALAPRPEDRYQDAEDLAVDLRRLGREMEAGAAPARRARLWRAAGAAGLVVAAAAATGMILWRGGGPPRNAPPPTHRQLTFTGAVLQATASPDGESLAYVEPMEPGGQRLMVQDLAEGKPRPLVSAPGIWGPRWSPDGTEIYAATLRPDGQGDTGHIFPREGGASRRLPCFLFAAWSPDGREIAGVPFVTARAIEIVDTITGEQRTLPIEVPEAGWFRGLDWSPEGGLLAFVKENGIWTIAASGGRPSLIEKKAWAISSPRFSPAGDALYYASGRKGDTTNSLWKVAIDPGTGLPTGEPKVILSGLAMGIDANTTYSAFTLTRDGRRMFYAQGSARENLWLVDLDDAAPGGLRTTQLTSGTSRVGWPGPRLSPDGRSVAFENPDAEMIGHVFVQRLDGSAPEQLTFGGGGQGSPVWSPDGSEIAFLALDDGAARVWRIPASGGTAQPFESTEAVLNIQAWAPGRKIVYQVRESNYILLDPSTGVGTPLLAEESPWWRVLSPRWSPDGARLAVVWNRSDAPAGGADGRPAPSLKKTVWVVPAAGGSEPLLAYDSPRAMLPIGWSSDGDWVYCITTAGMQTGRNTYPHPLVVKVPATGGPPVEVARLPFGEIANVGDVTPDGRRFAFTVVDYRSDAWVVEDFDPDRVRR